MRKLVALLVCSTMLLGGCEMLGFGDPTKPDDTNNSGGGHDMAESMAKSMKAPHEFHLWEGLAAGQTATWDMSGSQYMVGVVEAGDLIILEYTLIAGDKPVFARVELDTDGKTEKAWAFTEGNKGYEMGIAEPVEAAAGTAAGAASEWEVVKNEESEDAVDVGGTSVTATKWEMASKNNATGETSEFTVWYSRSFPVHPMIWYIKDGGTVGLVKDQSRNAVAYGQDYQAKLKE